MTTRQWLNHQLAITAWDKPGISPLNKIVIVLILLSISLLVLQTEPTIRDELGETTIPTIEFVLTAIFIVEYLLRLWSCKELPRYAGKSGRLRYMLSFFAILDLLAIVPSLLQFVGIDAGGMMALRAARVMRLARFGAFSVAFDALLEAVRSRRYELTVSFMMALALVLLSATGMWLVEGDVQKESFGSIPRAIWWSVVTMTTVGYGDATPVTLLGKALASFVAFLGIGLVAIPTGIMASAFADTMRKRSNRSE